MRFAVHGVALPTPPVRLGGAGKRGRRDRLRVPSLEASHQARGVSRYLHFTVTARIEQVAATDRCGDAAAQDEPPGRAGVPDAFESLQLLLPSTAIQTMPHVTATTPAASSPMPARARAGLVVPTSLATGGVVVTNGDRGRWPAARLGRQRLERRRDNQLRATLRRQGLHERLVAGALHLDGDDPSFTRGTDGSGMRPTTLSSRVTTAPVVP